jgi:hypothetical protein
MHNSRPRLNAATLESGERRKFITCSADRPFLPVCGSKGSGHHRSSFLTNETATEKAADPHTTRVCATPDSLGVPHTGMDSPAE